MKRKFAWGLWLPLAFQLLLVAAVPAPQVWAHATGTTVRLATAPVDPYDLLRGRYVTLGYDQAREEVLMKLPGWRPSYDADGVRAWVELAPPAAADRPWAAVAIHPARPGALPAGHVAIAGRWRYGRIDWGLGAYYIPEDAGDAIQAAMDAARPSGDGPPAPIEVEVRVAGTGDAIVEGLWIAGRRY